MALVVVAPFVVIAGLAARFALAGSAADAAGGALYTVLVYVVIAFVWPVARPARLGLAALAWSWGIELFQLTPVPADLGDRFAPMRLIFGSTFVATDLVAYIAGAVLAAWVDGSLRRRARAR